MRRVVICLVALFVFVQGATSVILPINWERLTCKVKTGPVLGTGFLLRYEDKVFIVTNRHLVEAGKTVISIPTNIKYVDSVTSDTSDVSEITPSASMYFWDERYDLAFIHVTDFMSVLKGVVVPESMIGGDSAIAPGREVFFLGYPGGLHGKDSLLPLVRGAIIAGETDQTIILDGNVFGGSSGSPLFLNPSPIEGQINASLLVGVISQMGTVPTRSNPQVMENMGIGFAIKVQYVQDVIRNWLDLQ